MNENEEVLERWDWIMIMHVSSNVRTCNIPFEDNTDCNDSYWSLVSIYSFRPFIQRLIHLPKKQVELKLN